MIDQRIISGGLISSAMLLLGLAAILMMRNSSAREIESRVLGVTRGRQTDAAPDEPRMMGAARLLFWIGRNIRGNTKFYSARDILVLEGMIAGSGLSPAAVLPVILGLKAVLMLAVPAIGFAYVHLARFSGTQQFLTLCICIPLGMLGPEWVLGWLRRRYMAELRRGIPDALDLLVVCSEAGMALRTALEHVSNEIRHSNRAVSVRWARTCRSEPSDRLVYQVAGRQLLPRTFTAFT